jgi:predicted oxidoreductase
VNWLSSNNRWPVISSSLFLILDSVIKRNKASVVLEELGACYGVSSSAIAFAWILAHPSRPIPIVGSQRIQALREALTALRVKLSREEWFQIWSASAGQEVA